MSTQFRLNDAVLSQKLGTQTVLMHIQSGEYFELNKTGSMVLESLLAGESIEAAALQLSQHFAVTPDQARQDVEALLTQLRARTLICAV